ncbi:MAG TPA: DUF3536 domain-containing protein [Gemmatimonadota bacterium]|nr:DUF3536 domain-containing protein [Gemmatimonadota bacterium]
MSRYVCIHGHFYQPPRENPWLEAVERQPSAAPYHDWNERITIECYRPNATARILDGHGRIERIVSNYERISFNVGPTLMAWLREREPEVHAAILEADERSRRRFSGHGSAIAQVYNHAILPLADERHRRTQVRWGLRDFERRFGRPPEGMWLPETAVDVPTLETLAAEGLRFTILAPHQARRVRALGGGEWKAVDEKSLETGRAYLQRLPSGRSIALFFYRGSLARGVAFDGLLESGRAFGERLLEVAREPAPGGVRLAHLAADGESYGHHHRFGEMALASALARVGEAEDVRLTNYAEFLERHPPEHEVEIAEETSWSCVHGIERWRSDCGCHTGGEEGWSQAWRAPLREAMDGLRDDVAPRWDQAAADVLHDPEEAVLDYVDVVLDRSDGAVDAFLDRHARGEPTDERRVRALRLLELERHLQLMYTSCGWFFNDLAGIETLQVLAYAARAVDLGRRCLQGMEEVEADFLETLAGARSNRPEKGSGRELWEREVLPRRADARDAAAHWAVRRAVRGPAPGGRFYAWRIEESEGRTVRTGAALLRVGRGSVLSLGTREDVDLRWGVLRLGELSLACGVRPAAPEGVGDAAGDADPPEARAARAVEDGDLTAALGLLEDGFPGGLRSIRDLWPDERRELVEGLASDAMETTVGVARATFERRAPLLRAMTDAGLGLPAVWEAAAALVFRELLGEILREDRPERSRVADLLERAGKLGVKLPAPESRRVARAALDEAADGFAEAPLEAGRLERLADTFSSVRALPFEVGWRRAQDRWWEVRERLDGSEAEPPAGEWLERFRELGEALGFAPGEEA